MTHITNTRVDMEDRAMMLEDQVPRKGNMLIARYNLQVMDLVTIQKGMLRNPQRIFQNQHHRGMLIQEVAII